MTTRRQNRECAVQLLFQLDMNPAEPDKAFPAFWAERRADPEARQFTEDLVRGVLQNLPQVDEMLTRCTEHWQIGRMGTVERSVLRLALYEMLFRRDIPAVVSINEAVDIAKYFSSSESGRFVNGILDRARKEIGRPVRE
ncbi:MAG: transcription antitermination factor NusB [Lentisphaerae bacterium]|nr:transcription antitermination factor NusB [Lentisphaerota bacterium]